MNLSKLFKNPIRLIPVFLVLLAIPLTISLIFLRQDLRQRAVGDQEIVKLVFSPGAIESFGNDITHLSVSAYDAQGQMVSGDVNFDWGISSSNNVGTLESINGNIASFRPLNNGIGDIYVTATNLSGSYTSSIPVSVGAGNISSPKITEVYFQPRIINTKLGAKPTQMSVLAYDEFKKPIMNGVTYSWGISSTNSIGRLFSVTGAIASFMPLKIGTGDIFVTATNSSGSHTSSIAVVVTGKTGDINGDSLINITDLSILLSNWSTTNSQADLNKDGIVNLTDLSILLSNWGK